MAGAWVPVSNSGGTFRNPAQSLMRSASALGRRHQLALFHISCPPLLSPLPPPTHIQCWESALVLTSEPDGQHGTGRSGQWWLGIFPEAQRQRDLYVWFLLLTPPGLGKDSWWSLSIKGFDPRKGEWRWNFSSLSGFRLKLCETVKANMFPWKAVNSFGFRSRRLVMCFEERGVCWSQVISCKVLEPRAKPTVQAASGTISGDAGFQRCLLNALESLFKVKTVRLPGVY